MSSKVISWPVCAAMRPIEVTTLASTPRLTSLNGRSFTMAFTSAFHSFRYGLSSPGLFWDCQVMLDRTFYAPIWDKSWPDDTLVEFEYMEDAP